MSNSHVLKITGSAELPEPLEMSHEYLISVKAEVNNINKKPNEDGTFTFSYAAKQTTCEVLKNNGEILKTKDKTKQSQKMRLAILNYQTAMFPDEDSDKFYQNTMTAIRHYLPEVIDFIKKLDSKN